MGWSEITPYKFLTYAGWEERPVSIADPEGTEIDAKFASDEDGELKIVLAPILRFADFPPEVKEHGIFLHSRLTDCFKTG